MQSHQVSWGIHVPPMVLEFVFSTTKNVKKIQDFNLAITGATIRDYDNPIEVLNFFQASLRNCINCVSLRRSFLHFI